MKVEEIYETYINGNKKDFVKSVNEYQGLFWQDLNNYLIGNGANEMYRITIIEMLICFEINNILTIN